jgi:septal ring factor EnvC (AmiA/AmiB activator)
MTAIVVEDADLRAFARVLAKLFGVQIQDDAAALSGLIHTLNQKVDTMSDNVTTKLDALTAATTSLEQRVSAQDAKLTTAQQERDAAVAELEAAKAQLAALPHDTTAQEQAIDAVIARLNAIDAAPVAASPAEQPPTTDAPGGLTEGTAEGASVTAG